MAEVHFFMTDADADAFASFFFDRFDAEFVPERSFTGSPPSGLRTLEELREHRRAYPAKQVLSYFILSPAWSVAPLITEESHNVNFGDSIYVMQRYGGPSFHFIRGGAHRGSTGSVLGSGSLSDYPWYIKNTEYLKDHSKYRTMDRPKTMVDAFNDVRKYLRRNGGRTQMKHYGKVGPWALQDAVRKHDSGVTLICCGEECELTEKSRSGEKGEGR